MNAGKRFSAARCSELCSCLSARLVSKKKKLINKIITTKLLFCQSIKPLLTPYSSLFGYVFIIRLILHTKFVYTSILLALRTSRKAGSPWSCLQTVFWSLTAGKMRPPRASLLWGSEKTGILNKTSLVLVSGARWLSTLRVWSSLSRVFKLSTSLCRFSSSSRQSLEPKLSKKKKLYCRCTYLTLKKWKDVGSILRLTSRAVMPPIGHDASTFPLGCSEMQLWWCVPSDCWTHVQLLSPTAPSLCLLRGFVSFVPLACTLPLERQDIYK